MVGNRSNFHPDKPRRTIAKESESHFTPGHSRKFDPTFQAYQRYAEKEVREGRRPLPEDQWRSQ